MAVSDVSMLGSSKSLSWEMKSDGLVVKLKDKKVALAGYVLKISLKE
jgi:hypothetical protein